MIKFAIIGTELKNVNQISHRLESEIERLNRKIKSIEENYSLSEERIKDASRSMADLSSKLKLDEAAKPENDFAVGDRRLEELHEFVIHAAKVAEVTQEKHEEALKKLKTIEAELGRAEERSRKAEKKVELLEREVRLVTNDFLSVEETEGGVYMFKASIEARLDELLDKLDKAEKKAEMSEKEVVMLNKTLERMEFFLKHACDQYTKS